MLSTSEAQARLRSLGANEIPEEPKNQLLEWARRLAREPMLVLLLVCAGIYLVIGDLEDALVLVFSVGVMIALTLYQEYKAQRALQALKDLSEPFANVMRDGVRRRIPSREIVPGDTLMISEGDRIPADARLVSSQPIRVDESLLTGESFAVLKSATSQADVYSGTWVLAGSALALVERTGAKTRIGEIGKELQSSGTLRQTLLQKEMSAFMRFFAGVAIIFSILILLAYRFQRGSWLEGLLAGIAAAMSLLPEEFPVVLTVFLAVGAWRISKVKVLVRQLSATESLGSITTLCVDKTGTLTQNLMRIHSVHPAPTHSREQVLAAARGASHPEPFDPMEKAIHAQTPSHPMTLVREYPLSPSLLALSQVWNSGSDQFVFSKGAPEAILGLCRLPPDPSESIIQEVRTLAQQGLRVLGVAQGTHRSDAPLPDSVLEFSFEWLGLIAFEDPIRPEVPQAIQECKNAGIRVIMMTGDYPETAQSIARQIGLISDSTLTGNDVETLNESELTEKLKHVSVFARMIPTQKLRVIKALQAQNQIVAMTGDGVNDAPSLKRADVGIAMGGRGTDVAREASALILLDDQFSSIVASIRRGRQIFENIKKAVSFILAVHVPIGGIAILPVLLGYPILLYPAHIVFLELIIDPACALIFESEPADSQLMHRPPRPLGKPLFGWSELIRNTLQGGVALILVLATFAYSYSHTQQADAARTMAFAALVLSNLGLIWVARSQNRGLIRTLLTPNPAFIGVSFFTLALLSLTIWRSGPDHLLGRMFGFTALSGHDTLICIGAGLLTTLIASFSLGGHAKLN